MSASPQSACIHTLDDDALLYIFTINANMFLDDDDGEDALRTTCDASQVCQRWRNLMLYTPSLWAKLIEIGGISCDRDVEWLDELIRRSGNALLWIRVKWDPNTQSADVSECIRQSFFDIVRENSHRIQKLVADFQVGAMFHPTSWKALCCPAPELETFDVTFERMEPPENPDDTPISTLFSGCAPMLRRFRLPCYAIDERVPWLCHLNSMEFDNTYSVRLVLGVLSSTHQLQELTIEHLSLEETPIPLPIASLPHLRYLEYRGRPQEGAILLDHIEIPLDCSLNIPTSYHGIPNATTKSQYLSIVTTFIRYAQRLLRSHKLISLHIDQHFSITMEVEAKCPSDAPLSISIPVCTVNGSRVSRKILKKLALQELSCVTKFKFCSTDPLSLSFWSIFRCFTSLRTICADRQTLGYLTEFQKVIDSTKKQIVLFPLLEVVKLESDCDDNENDIFKVDTVTAGFILLQMQNGYPITTLRLPKYCCTVAPDLEALTEAKGLKVVYSCWAGRRINDLEYICGGIDHENESDRV